MFDIGWTELMLIGIVALVVVGPKELPGMFRTMGRLTGKARMMARDFQRAMDDAADQTGLNEVSRDLQRTTSAVSNPIRSGLDAVNRKLDDLEKPRTAKPAVVEQPAQGATGSSPVPAEAPVATSIDESSEPSPVAVARVEPMAAPSVSPPPESTFTESAEAESPAVAVARVQPAVGGATGAADLAASGARAAENASAKVRRSAKAVPSGESPPGGKAPKAKDSAEPKPKAKKKPKPVAPAPTAKTDAPSVSEGPAPLAGNDESPQHGATSGAGRETKA